MLYKIIAKDIATQIKNDTYKEQQKLPAELVLADIYSTSKTTIRKALNILVNEGYVTNRPQSGYYINSKKNIEEFKFLELSSLHQIYPTSKIYNKIFLFQKTLADELVAKKLEIDYLTPVYFAIRGRYKDDICIQFETLYMPIYLFEDFNEEIYENSVYDYIETKYEINYSLKSITSGYIPKHFEKYIPNFIGKPISIIENISRLKTGQLFEYSVNYHIDQEFKVLTYRKEKLM